jgi:hypothetical protein
MRLLAVVLAFAAALSAKDKIAVIDFFGYKGIDVEKVRQALPIHPGDPFRKDVQKAVKSAVRLVLGRDATDVGLVCCIGDGDAAIFVGLPGESSRNVVYDPAPAGDAPVSKELTSIYNRKMDAWVKAVESGHAEEDGTPGDSILKDPATRTLQLAEREYALKHEDELVRTLQLDRHGEQRAIAADALGYCARTPRQLAALVRAVRDAEDLVRNNATRALGEILRGDPSAAAQIPPDPFIDLVRSGVWTDRNKGSMALMMLVPSAPPDVLRRIKTEAGDALAEIASWPENWAFAAKVILAKLP